MYRPSPIRSLNPIASTRLTGGLGQLLLASFFERRCHKAIRILAYCEADVNSTFAIRSEKTVLDSKTAPQLQRILCRRTHADVIRDLMETV